MGTGFQIAVAALTGVVLFLHALHGFSREVQKTGGEWLRRFESNRHAEPLPDPAAAPGDRP